MIRPRRDQFGLADLLRNLASGQRPSLDERLALLDLAEALDRIEIDCLDGLTELSDRLRSEQPVVISNEWGRAEKTFLKELFTGHQRRALWLAMSLIRLFGPR